MQTTWTVGEYEVSTDKNLLDVGVIHAWLCASYWAKGIPRETLERSIAGSLVFGVYRMSVAEPTGRRQVAVARMITDEATFAYLCDVYVDDMERGRGVGKMLMEVILAHPSMKGLRRICLLTRDAQGLYAQFGFKTNPAMAERFMELHFPNVYAEVQR
jgi:N-acetylglutamate synthase-like GNAT family acetyltransferase